MTTKQLSLTAFLPACAAMAQGQSFRVTVDSPHHSGSVKSLAAGLASPLAQEGAGDRKTLESDDNILRAATKLANGYRYTTRVDFVAAPQGRAVLYEGPNLSGGAASTEAIYHAKNIYLFRSGDILRIESRPIAYDLYDNEVTRFIMLGTPLPNARTPLPSVGSARFASSPSTIRRVTWHSSPHGMVHIESFIESDHRLVRMVDADVRADRREGTLRRYGNPGTLPYRSSFVRLNEPPPPFDYAKAFPEGLNVLDYRDDPSEPRRYTWTLDRSAKAPASEPSGSMPRIAAGGAGALLLATGLVKRKRRPAP